jgi:hypothetical protein
MTRYAHSAHSAALDEQLRRERLAQQAWLGSATNTSSSLTARDEFVERWLAKLEPIRWPEREALNPAPIAGGQGE